MAFKVFLKFLIAFHPRHTEKEIMSVRLLVEERND